MDPPLSVIKPNIRKAFELNLLAIAGIIILAVLLLVFLNIMVGLDIFVDTFAMLGVRISVGAILANLTFLVFLTVGLLLTLNYIALGKITYTLHNDRIVYSQTFFIIHIHDKTLPYSNIAKMTYKRRPFIDTATINFELSGMKEKHMKMDFIDNV